MGIRNCLVVARADAALDVPTIRRRIERLADFYAPLGTPRISEWFVDGAQTLVAIVDFDGRAHDLSAPISFGADLPATLGSTEALLDARAQSLRELSAPLAVVAARPDRIRVVTACGAPTMLYEARGPAMSAWSSHAVAAAYLATGRSEVDRGVLAEFLAAQFVGGTRSMIRDANAVSTATTIDLSPEGVESSCYWPAAERWRLVDPARAQEHAEQALLVTLPRQLESHTRPFCGLTGGLDSRVAAVALAQASVNFEALTFGEDGWPDLVDAPDVARRLGVPHHACHIEWTGDREALRTARAEIRWHEGAIQLGIGRIPWPDGMSAWVTGGGGETSRAFYYRERALRNPEPSQDDVAEALESALLARLHGASGEARDAVRRSVAAWIADARTTGVSGWRVLDVVYAEQRVRRWLRGMLTHHVGVTIPAFTSPEIQRGLASLPVSERTADGFHRRFLARHAPQLLPTEPAVTPPPLAQRILARFLRGRRPATSSVVGGRWDEHPEFRSWIADEILRSPALVAALGQSWCEATRGGFLRGDGDSERNALWAAGPVALGSELKTLPADATPRPARASPRTH